MAEEKQVHWPSFLTEVAICAAPNETELVLEIASKSNSVDGEVVQVADAFVAAAAAGMWSRHPATVRIPIELLSLERTGQTIRYVWRVAGIQPGAYHVLLNMLEVSHHYVEPLAFVRLWMPMVQGSPVTLKDIVTGPYPGKSAELPFALRIGRNLQQSRDPLIRFQFGREILDSELNSLDPLFLAWDRLVIRGGYCEDPEELDSDANIEESLAARQTYLAAPDTIEHLFYEFVGREEAYDAIVNMALRLHYAFAPLASIEID